MRTDYNDIKNHLDKMKSDLGNITENDEVNNYLKLISDETIINKLNDFQNQFNKLERDIPVCIPVYKFEIKNCSGIMKFLKEQSVHGLNRQYLIFTNDNQFDTCEFLNDIENFSVINVPDEINTLQSKRKYILDYCNQHNIKNIFFLDADVHTFSLPIKTIVERPNKPTYTKNKAFRISTNLAFDLWEFLIKKYNFKLSALSNNLKFAFNLNEFISINKAVIQCVHVNVDFCFKNDINYDPDSGWEDYDMQLQFLTKNIDTHVINIQYCTPSGQVSSTYLDRLQERYKINTQKLMNKWGEKYIRMDVSKGLFNCKIKFNVFKKCDNINKENILNDDW